MRTAELTQRYFGLYIGTVVSVEDPQKSGRIRLSCDQYDDSETDPLWAVVARPAGGATSMFFTPDVGDQVVFGFQVGDVNGPVVIGYAHNSGERKPPEQTDAATKKHGLVTRVGSIVFDEEATKIVITFTGSEISTVTIEDQGITLETKRVLMKADNVLVGSESGEPIPLGTQLQTWLSGHIHPTAMGPSGPPQPGVPFIVDNVLSKKNTVD